MIEIQPQSADNIHNRPLEPSCQGAHCWDSPIHIKNNRLVDDAGRTIMLRGVNLTGNSKIPFFPPEACVPGTEEFFNHRNLSFFGRPFKIDDAHEHFQRLHNWGLSFARLLVPWEALESKGPGIYDEEYIDHLISVLTIASKYGIKCFIGKFEFLIKILIKIRGVAIQGAQGLQGNCRN